MGLMLALPAPEGMAPAAWRAAAVAALKGVWWMTEALPIAATALLPLVVFPLLQVVDMRAAATPYANPLIFLFMGGFMIAMAMIRWQLHRRIALGIINLIGTRPTAIVLGFMVAAAFLSMWVSNTATAMMMMPIGLSVVELARGAAVGSAPITRDSEGGHFAVALMLAIAYACSVGGMGTLVGTPTNALLAGYMDETYGVELAFVDWLLLGVPLVIVALPVIFLVLTRLVYPIRIREIPGGRAFVRSELEKLGPMQRPEKMVAAVFALVAALWIFRPLLTSLVPGLTDTGVAMGGAVLLFVLPVDLKRGLFVLDWETASKLPWGVLILFGGGLSLADAINDTGLASWIGSQTEVLATWPVLAIVAVVVALIVFLTELTSNTATAAAFVPVVASVAIGMGQSPLLLAVPAVLAASCAFMLPVATPPNAIVYGSSFVTIPQMVRAGIVLNLLFIVIVTALAFVLLPLTMGVELGVVPPWATVP
jgi:sodium-dependent dicarboxylate transporter 2/3/5